ncbi:MAG TPA: hypothetical protein VFS67_21475 [Polyangiaceae bacterium]|nr:hypothetical protein [Polyangiaceae bacterium]
MRLSLLRGFCLVALVGLSGVARAQSEEGECQRSSVLDRVLGTGQWFWLQGKVMPGFELAFGRGLLEADLELSFIGLTQGSRPVDGGLVGNQLGAYLMLTPLRDRHYDVSAGLGVDAYFLWGIHPDAREAALAPRIVARFWPFRELALTASARSYLVQSDGLELGTARDGREAPRVLLSTGLTWRFQ